MRRTFVVGRLTGTSTHILLLEGALGAAESEAPAPPPLRLIARRPFADPSETVH